MSTDFLKKITDLQALFNEYRHQADEESLANGSCPSKEEVELRVKAATTAKELIQITDGAVKSKYTRAYEEQKEIAKRLVEELEKHVNFTEGSGSGSAAAAGSPNLNKKAPGQKAAAKESEMDTSAWYREKPKQGFDDVTGMQDVKDRLSGIVARMKRKALMSYLKINSLNGFLFYGPPGCGKTFLTEAFVHELIDENYKYLSLDAKDIHSKYSGESEKIVGSVFEEAEHAAPSLVFFDEMDAVCTDRQQPDIPQHTKSLTDAFLTAYNHLKSSDAQVFLIGATNYPQNVDPAMISRMELIRIPLPDEEARAFYFSHAIKEVNLTMSPELTVAYMAGKTENYSYRDLERLLGNIKEQLLNKVIHLDEESAIREFKEGKHPVTKEIFDVAFRTVLPSYDAKYMQALEKWEEDKGIKAAGGKKKQTENQTGEKTAQTALNTSYDAGIGFNNHPFTDIYFAYRFSEIVYKNTPGHKAESVCRVIEVKREIEEEGVSGEYEDRLDADFLRQAEDAYYQVEDTLFGGFKAASFLHSYDGYNTGAQGSAYANFHGTCGIVTCCNAINQQTGSRMTEKDGIDLFVKNGMCVSWSEDPGENGGTIWQQRLYILSTFGIDYSLQIRDLEMTDVRSDPLFNLGTIYGALLNGWSVLLAINIFDLIDEGLANRKKDDHGDVLQDDNSYPNHCVTVAGCSMDIFGNMTGLWVNDTGRATYSNRVFITIEKWYQMIDQTIGFEVAYVKKGGWDESE